MHSIATQVLRVLPGLGQFTRYKPQSAFLWCSVGATRDLEPRLFI